MSSFCRSNTYMLVFVFVGCNEDVVCSRSFSLCYKIVKPIDDKSLNQMKIRILLCISLMSRSSYIISFSLYDHKISTQTSRVHICYRIYNFDFVKLKKLLILSLMLLSTHILLHSNQIRLHLKLMWVAYQMFNEIPFKFCEAWKPNLNQGRVCHNQFLFCKTCLYFFFWFMSPSQRFDESFQWIIDI